MYNVVIQLTKNDDKTWPAVRQRFFRVFGQLCCKARPAASCHGQPGNPREPGTGDADGLAQPRLGLNTVGNVCWVQVGMRNFHGHHLYQYVSSASDCRVTLPTQGRQQTHKETYLLVGRPGRHFEIVLTSLTARSPHQRPPTPWYQRQRRQPCHCHQPN